MTLQIKSLHLELSTILLHENEQIKPSLKRIIILCFNLRLSRAVRKLGFADLAGANLYDANLKDANFEHASLKNASFVDANFAGASLKNARLEGAYLINVQNLTFSQIKSACNWEQAIYKQDNSENQKYIEDLKKDKSSDPKRFPDCSWWEK